MKRILILMAAVVTAAITVSAQSLFIGPQVGYTVSVNTPSQVSQEGAPTRIVAGALCVYKASPRMELHLSALYRIENGGFASPLSPQPEGIVQPPSGMINVVDPNLPTSTVISTVETSSIEMMAGLFFPVADLDTSGSTFTIGLSALADYMLSGSQADDYSGIPDYVGETTQDFSYVPHIGFGAALGVGLNLNMGTSGRIGFELQYVFREPREINVEQNGIPLDSPVNVSWLIGRGLRLSVNYLFAL